ncbi:MAG: aminomethyltransferase family protein [Bacteroidetes bacterium]|nr:aminomethyltransferase family protein [Bacteroidota bacterium]
MPIKSPFFPRMLELCTSMKWKEWAGYYAVSSYQVLHDPEYFAFRNSAGLLDVTPLFKYKVQGKDAAAYLSQIMVRNIRKLNVGRVVYLCWCTHEGKVVDDGTVMRRDDQEFFVTSADPCYSWFSRFLRGYEVTLEDVTGEVAGLALQGPTSREILKQVCDADLDGLKFFGTLKTQIKDFEVNLSRTGYTGDLGYEIWVDNQHALKLWDTLINTGKVYGIRPAGLDALDVTRVEAGLILKNVDYYNALHVLIEDRKSSPYDLSLGWIVNLDREPFNGQAALKTEKEQGSKWAIVGLDLDWPEIEVLYNKCGLPPEIGNTAWRMSIPIYSVSSARQQIGYATSGTWSPILKKNIALATIRAPYSQLGAKVKIEMTVEHQRHTVTATVHKPQFFDPDRKKSLLVEPQHSP